MNKQIKRGFAAVGLIAPKITSNVGGVMRAAFAYDAAMIAIEGARYKRTLTDTPIAWKHIPLIHSKDDIFSIMPRDTIPVAVDMIDGSTPLQAFTHPERAFYIFGPEDGTLGRRITIKCKHTIYIPTRICMNLAATVNVVLYDRMVKRGESFH